MGLEWVGILCSALTWTALYFTFKKVSNKEAEFSCRVVTAAHACIATSLSAWHCFISQPWPLKEPGGPNTLMQNFTLCVSLGYFLFDIIWCLYYQTEGYTMLTHHMVSIVAISRVLFKGVSATEAIAGIGGLEVTNPLLQMRWFLRNGGYKDSFIYKIVEVAFMTLFFVMRVVGGGYLVYCVVIHSRPDLEVKLLASSFYVLSLVFMTYIFQYFCAKYFKKASTKKSA